MEKKKVELINANCPLRSGKTIISCVKEFYESSNESLISCFKFGWQTHGGRLNYLDGSHQWINEGIIETRSQDLENYTVHRSCLVAKSEKLKMNKSFYGSNFIKTIDFLAIDIDDENDLKIARLIAEKNI